FRVRYDNDTSTKEFSWTAKDVFVQGFNERILHFLSERSSDTQLEHVERIDERFRLRAMPKFQDDEEVDDTDVVPPHPVRVFVSSTFADMAGERDLLARWIFPELRERARAHLNIDLLDIDLRWGVTEADIHEHSSLAVCLSAVARSHMFLGLLGSRYGTIAAVPKECPMELEWVKEYGPGTSMTEFEIHAGSLADPTQRSGRAFFYFRDEALLEDVPGEFRPLFLESDPDKQERLRRLKTRIVRSGH
ncbi:unnamed protein product, partial [Cyprideis torosa]